MRIKIGDIWYETIPNRPMMIELNEIDKINLARMEADRTRMAEFHMDDDWSVEQRLKWMNDGARTQATELQSMAYIEPGWYVVEKIVTKTKEEKPT